MKLRLLAAVVGLAMATGAAQAQIGVYATPIVSRVSNPVDTGAFAFLGSGNTSRLFSGVSFGAYDDFSHFRAGAIDAGVDIRGTFLNGNGAHLNSFLVGPRVVFKTSMPSFKPYVEAFIGVGSSRAPTNPVHLNRVEYGAAGGVDYTLGSHVDFRLIEIGYGGVESINSSLITGNPNPGNARLINFGTGIVFRFR